MKKNILFIFLFIVSSITDVWAETKEYPCIGYDFQIYAYGTSYEKIDTDACYCEIMETEHSFNFSVFASYDIDIGRIYPTYHLVLDDYFEVERASYCNDINDSICDPDKNTIFAPIMDPQDGTYYFKNNNASNDYFSCDFEAGVGFSNSRKHIPGQADLPTTSIEKTATIQSVTGQVITATLTDIQTTDSSGKASDVMAVVTNSDSSSAIERNDGSVVEVQPKTIAAFNPPTEVDGQTTNNISLIRGEISLSIDCAKFAGGSYVVKTPMGTISIVNSCIANRREITDSIKLKVKYSQIGVDGQLNVSVAGGSVIVTANDGSTTTLSAGQDKTINNLVAHTSWVLPIDGDKIYGGKVNQLVWTAYPGAVSYLLEYNFPSPIFSDENTKTAEFPTTIPITDFTTYEDLIIYTISLSKGLDGKIVEARIFAVDANGSIIAESVSSDRFTVTWKDL